MTDCALEFDRLPFPSIPDAYGDALQRVRVATPLPDLLPRNFNDIKRMRDLYKDAENGKKYVPPRRKLPAPFVDDDGTDEFEDKTIHTEVEYLSEIDKHKYKGNHFSLEGPSVEGEMVPVFDNGLLFKITTADGAWYYYNDSDKYEMLVKFTFGAQSDLVPGEQVQIFIEKNNEITASLIIYPGETRKLISGKVNGYKSSAKAIALCDEQRALRYHAVNCQIEQDFREIASSLESEHKILDEENALIYCQEKGVPYIDCIFKPHDYSLYRPDKDHYRPRFLSWHRPSSWVPFTQLSEIRLFRRTILPSHVTQGSIGDTYLTSAMSVLAQRPHAVKDLFRHPISAVHGRLERALGAFWVTLNYHGCWVPVLLDNYLPSTRDGAEYCRCAMDIRRLWPALLEKAYAKVHGSYANIASGDPLEPLVEFTGYPVSRLDALWEDSLQGEPHHRINLFNDLSTYASNGALIMFFTPSDGNETYTNMPLTTTHTVLEDQYHAIGLKLQHGYAAEQFIHMPNENIHLVRICNPWEDEITWNGKWGKNDILWETYPTIRSICFPDGTSPSNAKGFFWIEWDDALRLFKSVGCCHINKKISFDYRIRGLFEESIPSVSLEINVSAVTEAYIMLSQADERDDQDNEYNAILLSVFKHVGKKEKLDCSSNALVEKPDCSLKFNFSREVALRYTFTPENSPYFVIPRVHDGPKVKPYVLGLLLETYAGNGIKVEFKKIKPECKVFSNVPSFSQRGMVCDVAAEYQIRTPRQPIECIGAELVDERLKAFDNIEEL